ncbi:hydrogenase [Arcobacter sp. FWKO B]|uniref:hydrogenase n=1 Tax=Arcobacter sp. FWKO B TaxID=2593672 RepID=UPI0018A3A535|nr:hydrogenase [Arcobacter sp. FWKO B]QOG12596.1 hydrogenase [Arcobacter sp. FWKO B]
MAIQQTIEYKSTNNYFAGFLQALINEAQINASVDFDGKTITLKLDDTNQEKLELFSNLCNKYLPYSLFLGDITTTQENLDITPTHLKSDDYNIALCPKCLEMISNPSSNSYLDDSIVCNHYSNEGISTQDYTTFSPHYSEGCSVLLTDASKVDDLFIMTDEEKKALFSIEKPSIKVTIADETLKELTGKNYIWIKSPSTIKSTLVALNAKDSGVAYLFFDDNYENKAVVIQKNITFLQNPLKILENLDNDSVINKFLNIKQEAKFDKAIGAVLPKNKPLSFLLHDGKTTHEIIKFNPFDLQSVMMSLRNDENKSKLITNFEAKFPHIIEALNQSNTTDFFEAIAIILELENGSFDEVSDTSCGFRGNGGLKLDTNFADGGMDYSSFLSTLMSFKLADTPDIYLAYSVYESIADMVISILSQLKDRYKIEHFIMMGDMLENSVVYSRILSKFAMSNPYFSKEIGIK